MISVNLNDVWNLTEEDIILAINEVTKEIINYLESRKNNSFDMKRFGEMYNDFGAITSYWVGNTYVGEIKSNNLKNAFNLLFSSFMRLLLFLKSNKNNSSLENKLYINGLYTGKLYRYLGNGDSQNERTIEVEYDNLYVSWTKKSRVPYIESKLYGDYIILSAMADDEQQGIDIHALQIGRPFEGEVIFPTYKNKIICVSKVKREDSYE